MNLAAFADSGPPLQYSIQAQESIKTVMFLSNIRLQLREAAPLRPFQRLTLFENLPESIRIALQILLPLQLLKHPQNILVYLNRSFGGQSHHQTVDFPPIRL